MASVAARGLNHIVSKYAQGHGELAFREMLGGAMRVKIAIAASVILLATANSRAENNKGLHTESYRNGATYLWACDQKNTDPSCSSSDSWQPGKARPDRSSWMWILPQRAQKKPIRIYVCDDEGVGARAQGDELVSRLPTGEAALRRGRLS
jgi:hypothetical protein